MSISLSIFLYIYFFAIAVFALGSIFVIYHIIRFSFNKKLATFFTITFITISLLILFITAYYALQIDWSQSIDFSIAIF